MSAAVQPPQHQQTSPTARDPYASPSSRRTNRPANPNAASPNTAQHASYASPSNTSAMTTPRATEPMSSSTYKQFYPDSAATGPAAALPIRTSSQNATTSAQYDIRPYVSKSSQQSAAYAGDSDRERASDNETRQRVAKYFPDDSVVQRPSRQAPTQRNSTNAVGQAPTDDHLPREPSTIIQHIVVDDPQTDIARERARMAEARPTQAGTEPGAPPMTDQTIPADPEKHRSRQEFRQTTNRKEVKFGDYILGQTLGEGEFGKVKMGWKRDSSVQVAIKLMHIESLQSNSTRLPKIYREINILKRMQHPNIVRLHEFVETKRHMGIILEYASGGELFDYILNHRYLKDPAARRLFAQLISGVGYLHKNGIVHRDLKLENLLLDRNKNIIITDFGFANTFDPNDELGDEVEHGIGDKEFVQRHGLDKLNKDSQRRGDLMQTSCGSPCYAAPELVVSDGLYTGRKVDVWSCGVILYAMLAGYLPFDDDPNNPEGDNINLLYKYITNSPLTFPEYVTPQARDMLKQILVPNPRKRADLFTVARHSWLSEYSHVVGFIGSTTNSNADIASSAMSHGDAAPIGRSVSVRESNGRSPAPMSAGGVPKQVSNANESDNWQQRDAKRRTVQLEYVSPEDQAARGQAAYAAAAAQQPIVSSSGGRTRARGDGQGPVEVASTPTRDGHIPRKEVPSRAMPPPATRPGRDQIRAASDSPAVTSPPSSSQARPTNGFGARLPSRGNSYSQPAIATPTTTNAQGHFSQPKAGSGYIIAGPMGNEQTGETVRPVSQQALGQYGHPQPQDLRPSQRGHKRSSTLGSIGDRLLGRSNSRKRESSQAQRTQNQESYAAPSTTEKRDRKYPPVSMRNAMPAAGNNNNNNQDAEIQPRPSTESTRRTSFGFSRRNIDTSSTSDGRRNSRRFSFLPSFGSGRKYSSGAADQPDFRPESKSGPGPGSSGMAFGRGASRSPSRSTTNSTIPLYYDQDREAARANAAQQQLQQQRGAPPPGSSSAQQQSPGGMGNYNKALPPQPPSSGSGQPGFVPGSSSASQQQQRQYDPSSPPVSRKQWRDDGYGSNLLDLNNSTAGNAPAAAPALHASSTLQPTSNMNGGDPVERFYTPNEGLLETGYHDHLHQQQQLQQQQEQQQMQMSSSMTGYAPGAGGDVGYAHDSSASSAPRPSQQLDQSSIRPNQRKFANEYDHGYAGSSSATRRVMDFFRRRGRDRNEDL